MTQCNKKESFREICYADKCDCDIGLRHVSRGARAPLPQIRNWILRNHTTFSYYQLGFDVGKRELLKF